ncbi:MAG TPA: hypothetical protein VKU41_07455 [Polyangiaceae bacterium]|nr:hypothetical protein [Polyangiaceae bacterium]
MRGDGSLRTSGSTAERLLLGAGSAERPEAESVNRTAAALGLAPRALVAGGIVALVLRYLRWTSRWARAAVGVGGLGAVALAAYAVAARGGVTSSAVAPSARAPTRTETPMLPSAGAPVGADTIAHVSTDTVRPAAPHPVAAARATARAGPAPDTLGEQTQRLDRARAAVEAGDAAGALATLDEFDRRYPSTALGEESSTLRVEALVRRGDREAAGHAARQFLKRYPASVHAVRVTELLRSLSP